MDNFWLDRRNKRDTDMLTGVLPRDDAWNKRWQHIISQQGSGSTSQYMSSYSYSSTSYSTSSTS
jgi:hypothetical protein